MARKSLSTLALDKVHSLDKLDISFYESVLSSNSLKDLDYYHSRVFNNPAYSSNLISQSWDHFNPSTDKFYLLTTVETHDSDLDDTHNSEITSNVTCTDNSGDVMFGLFIESIINKIEEEYQEDSALIYPVLAWYLSNINCYYHHEKITPHYNELALNVTVPFQTLHKYIGSRQKAPP